MHNPSSPISLFSFWDFYSISTHRNKVHFFRGPSENGIWFRRHLILYIAQRRRCFLVVQRCDPSPTTRVDQPVISDSLFLSCNIVNFTNHTQTYQYDAIALVQSCIQKAMQLTVRHATSNEETTDPSLQKAPVTQVHSLWFQVRMKGPQWKFLASLSILVSSCGACDASLLPSVSWRHSENLNMNTLSEAVVVSHLTIMYG